MFERELQDILRALETGLEIVLAPEIGKGARVNIKNGPLAGIEGWVEERYGFDTVLLRLNFIGQAAAVKVNAADLEPI
jgi:transcription antitermination factor NusG